ncbi:MAG: ribbon-helix-helix domain-containing protein [Campylobacterales bacterium]
MHSLEQLEKQQVGLRLPKYLIEQIDELTKEYSLNRSEIITESIKSFREEQKERRFYREFDSACKELVSVKKSGDDTQLDSLEDLIDELSHKSSCKKPYLAIAIYQDF